MDRSINLLSLITLYGTFLGFLIAFFLLFVKSEKNKANTFLGILILSMTSYLLPPFVYFIGLLESLPHVVKIYLPFGFMMGPMLYLYIRTCTQRGFKLTPQLYLHFVPFVLCIFYFLPIFMMSGAEKIDSFNDFFSDEFDSNIPFGLMVIQRIHGLVYFIISIRLVLRYKKHLDNNTSNIDVSYHRWLLIFCSSLLIPALVNTSFLPLNLNYFNVFLTIKLLYGGYLIFFLAMLISIMLKPEIFHAFPHQMLIPDSKEEKTQRYESSNLKEVQKEVYLKKLIAFVEEEKPYLEAELTLSDLSEQTKIPSHYLSQVINEKLDCSFLDFINGYRVEEAKAKLADPKLSHYTIIATAYESGFNSKSAFYAAFKKLVGTTPSAFRKSLAG